MGSQPLHGKTTPSTSNSITTSLRMKTATLFSLAFLVLAIAFLNPASGCDCVKFIKSHQTMPQQLINKGIRIPKALLAKTPNEVCAKADRKILDVIAKQQ